MINGGQSDKHLRWVISSINHSPCISVTFCCLQQEMTEVWHFSPFPSTNPHLWNDTCSDYLGYTLDGIELEMQCYSLMLSPSADVCLEILYTSPLKYGQECIPPIKHQHHRKKIPECIFINWKWSPIQKEGCIMNPSWCNMLRALHISTSISRCGLKILCSLLRHEKRSKFFSILASWMVPEQVSFSEFADFQAMENTWHVTLC